MTVFVFTGPSLSAQLAREHLDAIPAGPVVVHCAVGVRGHTAARILSQHGREVRNLDGGFRTWQAGIRSRVAALKYPMTRRPRPLAS